MKPDRESFARGESTKTSPESRPRHEAAPNVYEQVVGQLRLRGWTKGTNQGDALCLVAAIDTAVGLEDVTRTGTTAAKLARAGRVGSHLRDLIGVRNLAAWSDEPSRTFDEVVQLLEDAALAFPED